MNRDKQIEEMANDYYEAMLKARGTLGSMNEGAPKWYAKELYNAGYRKASDVAEEIFEEIEEGIVAAVSALQFSNSIHRNVKHETYSSLMRFVRSIKNKYTEGSE